MTVRCAPEAMKDLMSASFVQSERVQKVLRASRNVLTARFPFARRACQTDRNAATKKLGRYLHDLRCRRVIETNGMSFPELEPGLFPTPRLAVGERSYAMTAAA